MITWEHYREEMIKTAIGMQREPNLEIIGIMWESVSRFKWTDDEFTNAIQQCRLELTRFPHVSEIRERFVQSPKPEPEMVPVISVHTPEEDQEIESLIMTLPKEKRDLARKILRLGEHRSHTPRVYCPVCDDEGVVEVYSPPTAKTVIARAELKTVSTEMVACHCRSGQVLSETRDDDHKIGRRPYLEFCRLRMLKAGTRHDLKIAKAELEEFYKAKISRVSDFDDWTSRAK